MRQDGRGGRDHLRRRPSSAGHAANVLEMLREAGAPATFFLAGEQVERRPTLAAEIVAAGHRVELHCHRHRNQLRLTPAQLLDDAERARAAIEDGRPARRSPTIALPTGSSAGPACGRSGAVAGGRSSGLYGGGTGPPGASAESIVAGDRRGRVRATCCSCMTRTTTAPGAPGPEPSPRCRSSSSCWPRAA